MDKPEGLNDRASLFWDEVSSTYSLRVDEWHILISACNTITEISRLEATIVREPLMTRGSRGQPVVNPAVAEVSRHRALLARLLRQLDLPDPQTQRSAVSERKAKAAHARWDRVRAQREGSL